MITPPTLALIDGIGTPELILTLVIALLLFGPSKLPELARGMGKAITEFKKAANGLEDDIQEAAAPAPATAKPAPEPLAASAKSVSRDNLPNEQSH